MIEYQYFKVVNTSEATPRGTRPRGGRYRISFPAPMIEYQYFKVVNTSEATPRGTRQFGWRNAVGATQLVVTNPVSSSRLNVSMF